MTDIEIYDRGIYEYLSYISPNIVYAPNSIAHRKIAEYEKNKDLTPWSFISYYRDPSFEFDTDRMNFTSMRLGQITQFDVDASKSEQYITYVRDIPVNLTYQVDIWAAKATTVLELATKLVSQLQMKSPVLKVPMNPGGEEARFYFLDITWNDNSDIENEQDKGKIYRHTFTFKVDARIKLVREVVAAIPLCGVPVELYEEGNQ